VLPAEPEARAVIGAILVADVPVAIAARAAGVRRGRAERILRDAVATAGSERLLREVVAGPLGALNLSIGPGDAEDGAPATGRTRRWWTRVPGRALGAATAAALLIVLATARPPGQTQIAAPAADRASEVTKGPPPAVIEPGVLPTLERCGIGPPDAPLAYAGWLTVEELGAAPPDAVAGQQFYALVPDGDVAWNPPGLSRRVMPPVRGRLACLSTVTGEPMTVVGLPAAWAPPPPIVTHPIPTRADCGMPARAPLAHRGWLTAEQLTGERSPRPIYAIVSERGKNRVACMLDPDAGRVARVSVARGWTPPQMVDGCPASPVQRFAGYLESGGPDAFVLLPPLSGSAWTDDPTVRLMARLSPGPSSGSVLTATARPLGAGQAHAIRVTYSPTPADRVPSETHYVWLEGAVFPRDGCWIITLAIDDQPVGWAVMAVRQRRG
jgi:hypothetical protein